MPRKPRLSITSRKSATLIPECSESNQPKCDQTAHSERYRSAFRTDGDFRLRRTHSALRKDLTTFAFAKYFAAVDRGSLPIAASALCQLG
jgi:hypothetical protein